jgi:hypothetical protein
MKRRRCAPCRKKRCSPKAYTDDDIRSLRARVDTVYHPVAPQDGRQRPDGRGRSEAKVYGLEGLRIVDASSCRR